MSSVLFNQGRLIGQGGSGGDATIKRIEYTEWNKLSEAEKVAMGTVVVLNAPGDITVEGLNAEIEQLNQSLNDKVNTTDIGDLAKWKLVSFGMSDSPQRFGFRNVSGWRSMIGMLIATGQGTSSPIVPLCVDGSTCIYSTDTSVLATSHTESVTDFTVNSYGGNWGTYTFIVPKETEVFNIS